MCERSGWGLGAGSRFLVGVRFGGGVGEMILVVADWCSLLRKAVRVCVCVCVYLCVRVFRDRAQSAALCVLCVCDVSVCACVCVRE